MAKRKKTRINTKFITALAVGGVAVVGGGYGLLKFNHRNKNPQVYIAAGDQAAMQHDYVDAAKNFQIASSLLPLNAELHWKLGKAYFQLRALGGSYFSDSRAELTQAEELNPDYKEAWAGLLEAADAAVSQSETNPNAARDRDQLPAWISVARDAADHLNKLDPNNLQAQIAISSLKIRVWLLKMTIPPTPKELRDGTQTTDEQKVDEAVATLTKLMAQHPEDATIPYWIARAKIKQAMDLLNLTPNDPNAIPLFAEAADEFDNSIGAEPKDISLYLKKAEILDILQHSDPFAATVPTYRRAMRQSLDSAQTLADISNPDDYQAAKVQWARYLRKQDPARSEEVYRDLIKRFSGMPQYQLKALQYRIELADLLQQDTSRQKDALALLDAIPSEPPANLINYEQKQGWANWASYAQLVRAQIETAELSHTPGGKQRDDLIADITASFTAADNYMQGSVPLLEARAKFQLATDHLRDAIQTVTMAADKSTQQTGGIPYDLLRLEAQCYMRGSQTGRAILILENEISKNPQIANSGEIQGLLANLYIQNKDFAGAKPHVEWLSVRAPDDPAVISLEIQELGPDPDQKLAKPLFDKLPEQTPAQIAIKLNIAQGLLKNQEEAIRLVKMQHAADPGAPEPVRELIVYYRGTGNKEAAQTVFDEFSKASPGNPNIPIFADVVNGDTPQQVWQQQLKAAEKIPDPFQREVRLADVYASGGLAADELTHLLAAAKYSPDDVVTLQRIFFLYIEQQRYGDAEAMLPHLSALDADSAHGLMLKAKLALARKDINTALVVSRQLTKDSPEFSGSWEIYGEALEANGEAESACQQFSAAIDRQATNVDARRGLIDCSVQQGKFDDARRYIKDARDRFPDDPVYKEMQVGFELRYGDPESIVSDVTQSLKDHPEVRKNYTLAAQALLASSSAASGRGDIDAATHYMDRAKAVYQQGIARWPDDLQFSIGLAEVCLQRNDMSGAESALKTLAARPRWKNQPAPLTVLAQIEMRAKHLDVAESLLKQALALDANYVQARTLLADCLVAEKEYEDALATLKPACGEFVVLDKYVRLLLQLSRGSEAEDKVVAAREKDPNNPGLTNLLIDVYQSEHKADEALKLANASISADPTNIGAYLRRGELEASGVNADLDAARKDLRYYADAIPTDVRASMMLAEVLDASQDHDGAIRELQSAVKYAPLERQPRLMLLREYLFAKPSRDDDAQHLLTATLALPEFQHDPVFEMQEAKLFAEKGDGDQAFTAAHDAIAHAQDKSSMVDDYLSILLLAKKYSLLLDESKGYAADPKTNWSVFVYRGSAKHLSGDDSGAIAEFQTALDRAGADKGTHAAREVVANIAAQLGADKALELIAPREKNSAFWTLVSIDLNSMKKAPNAKAAEANTAAALAAAESANGSFDTFDADDQNFLLDRLASLYIRSVPPKSEQALAVWQKMYARNPNNVDAMNNIASVLSDMTTPPRPKDALVWSQKAYDLCKASNLMIPAIYDTHGWVLIQCGRLDDGIAVLHEAIDRSDFPDAHYHLAMGYLKQKHPEDAKRELETASQMLLTPNRTFTLIDPDLKAKIDSALKQADQNIQASAGSVPPG